MTRTTAITAAAFGIVTFSTMTPALAQDAKAIMMKAASAYGTVKSYQAQMEMNMAANGKTNKMTMDVKTAGDKLAMSIKSSAAGFGGGNIMMVMDGTNMYNYMAASNQYIKMPVDPNMKAMIKQQGSTPDQMIKQFQGGTLKKLADSTVDGKPVFVISATDPKKPKDAPAKIYIDKASYHIKKVEGTSAGGPMGAMSTTIFIRNEKINPSFPANTFVFTPPKGAKQMQMPQMGGGAPRKP